MQCSRPARRSTLALSEAELERLRVARQAFEGKSRTSLVVYSRDGAQVISLSEKSRVVIGRSSPADVSVRDESLSRKHAAVELVDGVVWVEDLKSTNGTLINGERIERSRLESGDELTLGAVTAFLQSLDPADAAQRGLMTHDRLQAELDAEVSRARTFGRPLALVVVKSTKASKTHVGRWLPSIRELLRPFDRLALYSSDTVELLLPEANENQANELACAITENDAPLQCGVAVFPLQATSADEIYEAAVSALRRTSAKNAVEIARPAASLRRTAMAVLDADGPVMASAAMQSVFTTARRVAMSTIPVLITGETGTGKELVANAIHEKSKRSKGPMIFVNCGAVPEQLVESTLFGHEKGAFTGAGRRAEGVFEAANGGTVFLDEVGELPAPAQAALLRVLETKRFTRVGAPREIEVDVRVVAATHRDLKAMADAGDFRADLLYRLNAIVLEIPPIRDRADDIEPLARRFVHEAAAAYECDATELSDDALEALKAFPWPGNVRELRNAIERAVVISDGRAITVADLPAMVQAAAGTSRSSVESIGSIDLPALDTETGPIDLKAELDRIEEAIIRRALDRAEGDRNETARLLGLPVRTLSDKIRKHGIK